MKSINNEGLKRFLMTILKKNIDSITDEDLSKIEGIPISSMSDNEEDFDYSLLELFPNLKDIYIKNKKITKSELNMISKSKFLKRLFFEKCSFENEADLGILNNLNLEELTIDRGNIKDFKFLNFCFPNLKKLEITDPIGEENYIDAKLLINKLSLNELTIQYGKIINTEFLGALKECETLNLFGSELKEQELSFLEQLPKLKELFISEVYEENEIIKKLARRIVVHFNLYEVKLDYNPDSLNKQI